MNNKIKMSVGKGIVLGIVVLSFIFFMAILIFIIPPHSMGYYQEGKIGFIADIASRIFVIYIIGTLLTFGYIFKEKWQHTVIWCICAVIACVVSFYLLRAPILDLPYINRPASMNLNYVTFENDNNHEYAVFYKLTGYTANNETKVFEINSKTYDKEKEKWKNNETVSGDIKYLPHTGILMHLNTFEQK